MAEDTPYVAIAKKIRQGEVDRQKMAAFHTQVLLHAKELSQVHASTFCSKVGVPESFGTEFRKMVNVAEMLRQLGYHIEKD